MSQNPEEYIRLGESAAVRCVGGQTQYNSRYLTGENGREVLSEGLDWVDDPTNYHGIYIKPADACILAGRIIVHRITVGATSLDATPNIPCEDCPFADVVLADQAR